MPKVLISDLINHEQQLQFSIQVIELSSTLPSTPEGRVVRNQFTKSGTSVGANYREANRARSKADFIHKLKLVRRFFG